MRYDGVLYRPPSEAQSLLLQVTVGCSYNRCTFCDMYRDKQFRVKDLEEVRKDIEEAANYRFRRVFLCDGDALVAPQPFLVDVLSCMQEKMPFVDRVGTYGDCRSILKKKPEDLKRLAGLKLGIIYHGIESGDDAVLKAIKKGSTAAQTIEAGLRVKEAGILYSAIVLLGIAGRDGGLRHAEETAKVLNAIQPDFIGVLTTMVCDGTPLANAAQSRKFVLPSRLGLLEELKVLLENLRIKKGLLTSNHSSNYLPLRVVFPYQREEAVARLQKVLENKDETVLKPEYLRGL
jgi:radical SAM superfamily enzyme YgiQ (UPF0313 family)